MAVEISMPQLSDTMDKGTILTWLKSEGEAVSRGDALAEVATDKADLEIESFHEGTLLKILAPKGTTVKVGDIIAVVGEPGENVSVAPTESPSKEESPKGEEQGEKTEPSEAKQDTSADSNRSEPQDASKGHDGDKEAQEDSREGPSEASSSDEERIKISPLAKNFAEAHGFEYSKLQGTGEGGRIVRRDVEEALGEKGGELAKDAPLGGTPNMYSKEQAETSPAKPPVTATLSGSLGASQPMSRMRETIASRMVESVNTNPHFYLTAKYIADEMLKLREILKEMPQYEGLTINHLMVKAVSLAIKAVPKINSHYQDGSVVQSGEINIGIVTALEDGLLIPVLKQVDSMHLSDLITNARALVQRARAGRPKAEDLSQGTFSISNIGRSAVEDFTAIINPGQGGILAVSSVQDEPVVRDGLVVPAKVLRVTLSLDHRILDGVVGGEFLTELKRFVESPALLLA